MIRTEVSNALPKLLVKNLKDNKEEELIFSNEKIYSPGVTEMRMMFMLVILHPKQIQEHMYIILKKKQND